MAKPECFLSSRTSFFKPLLPIQKSCNIRPRQGFHSDNFTVKASLKRDDLPHRRHHSRPLITISTSPQGKWQHSEWSSDYTLTLKQLQLEDLTEDYNGNDGSRRDSSEVVISLCTQKHAGFGLSVTGKITTSLSRKCSVCDSAFCSEISSDLRVWILPSRRQRRRSDLPLLAAQSEIPVINGDDDPSVIYVKPGCEADLDSLIQDTIRLAIASARDICSESCERAEPKHVDVADTGQGNPSSFDGRWSKLLELRRKS